MTSATKNEYSVHLDNKNRFVIRGAKTKYWVVKEFSEGHLLLSPQKLVEDPPISKEVLAQIDRSVANMRQGNVFGPIDISAARRLLAKRGQS